jgi:Co/Zn/Cd efflux system component
MLFIKLVKESALILLQTVPKEIEVQKIKTDLVRKVKITWLKFFDLVYQLLIEHFLFI